MPLTKDALTRQAGECRRKIEILLDLKNDVDNCVNYTVNYINEEIAKTEEALETANPFQIKQMIQTLRNARQIVKEYEEGFEKIRRHHEDVDLDERLSVGNSNSLDELLASAVKLSNGRAETLEQEQRQSTTGTVRSAENGSTASASEPPIVVVVETKPNRCEETVQVDDLVAVESEPNGRSEEIVQINNVAAEIEQNRNEEIIQIIEVPEVERNGSEELVHINNIPAEIEQIVVEINGSVAAAAAEIEIDYRKHIVGKGNGNAEDCCQRSVELSAGRVGPLQCTMSHVESPSLFWIQLFNNTVENIEDDLTTQLETEKKALSGAKVGDYCVAPVEEDVDCLRRAKILEIKDNKLGTSFAKILYIDTGKIDWVATKALLAMPSRLRCYLRQAIPCSLVGAEPISGFWSRDVVDAFAELCAESETTQLLVKGLDEVGPPEICTVTLDRTRTDVAPPKTETVIILLIRAIKGKVRRGEPTVPAKAFEKEDRLPIGGSDPPDVIDGWRCLIRALENEPNAADSEPEMADEQASARLTTRSVRRVAALAEIAERRTSTVVPGTVQPMVIANNADEEDGMVYFRVTEAISPGEFYIQLRDRNGRNDNLDQLSIDMNNFYSNPTNQLILSPTDAQCAVVRWTLDGKTGYRRVWIKDWQMNSRPNTLETRDMRVHSTVMATFLDDGFCRRLETKDTFVLDKRFCALPAQSAFCKLFECHPNSPNGIEWSQNSIDIFKELCTRNKYLMKGLLTNAVKQPYEMIVTRLDANGQETCINAKMVEANCARSGISWP